MSRKQRTIASRDQRASAFSASLMRLCDATLAHAAALVDAEGETVDYAGTVDPFDIKVTAAECMVLFAELRQSPVLDWARSEQMILRGAKKSYFVQALEDGYAIVVQLSKHGFGISQRGLHEAIRELCAEAGLSLPARVKTEQEPWWRVEVRCESPDGKRPTAVWVGNTWALVEVLGRWSSSSAPRDAGYRVRLPSGAELTLVRERLGRWFADTALSR